MKEKDQVCFYLFLVLRSFRWFRYYALLIGDSRFIFGLNPPQLEYSPNFMYAKLDAIYQEELYWVVPVL